MSKRVNEKDITNTKIKKLKKGSSIDEAKTEIVNTIIDLEKQILEDPLQDSTNGLGDTIKEMFQLILNEFKDFIEENEDKKYFIGGLIKLFTTLLGSRATAWQILKKW